MPQIEVAFDIDANGILNVSAKDKATGKEQSIVIKASSGLSDEEIEAMVQDAEANADADQEFEALIQVRNQADSMVHASKKTLEEAGDKATDEEKTSIEAAIKDLEAVIQGANKDDIEAKTNALTTAMSGLAEKMYADAAAAETADAGDAEAEDSNADAVDAEFKEVKD